MSVWNRSGLPLRLIFTCAHPSWDLRVFSVPPAVPRGTPLQVRGTLRPGEMPALRSSGCVCSNVSTHSHWNALPFILIACDVALHLIRKWPCNSPSGAKKTWKTHRKQWRQQLVTEHGRTSRGRLRLLVSYPQSNKQAPQQSVSSYSLKS